MVTDPRPLLANERTVLAWLRTGASLITLGFAVAKLGQWLRQTGHQRGISVSEMFGGAFALIGAVSVLLALARYHKIRKALLAGTAAPIGGAGISIIIGVVGVIGLVLGVYVFFFRSAG
jgi:putative membrane protein